MEPRRSPLRSLAEKLHSLLGLKTHLTSNWATSVCAIIKTIPSEPSPFPISKTSDDDDADPCGGGSAISKLRGDLATLDNCASQLHLERRQVLNDFLDLKGNIRVFCRVRPYVARESSGCFRPVLAADANNVILKLAGSSKSKKYTFDRVFPPASSQEEVFSEVEPVIRSVIDGYNACIFAYGQTSTGKTFTMEGSRDAPGLVPRAMEALFRQASGSNHALHISFSMFEIYMGNLRDLLVPKPTKGTHQFPPCLSMQTNKMGEVEIENLVAIQVNDLNQALRLYRFGCRLRSTASTNSNMTSSRSHCMIRLQISGPNAPGRRRETNKMWLVDLGGSERVLKTKASGRRLEEGKAINLSLSALGDVIYSLQRKRCHVPYRNSKLTQVLKDSLGDDSKALMLVHVSPKEEDLCETICSLNFATRVKSIHLGQGSTLEMKWQKETAIANLQQRLESIEEEQLQIGREIERINKEIDKLTGKAICSEEQLDFCDLFAEEPVSKTRVAAITAAPSSKMPRFMRPTVCSQRKSAAANQTMEQLEPANARRRKPSSHRAESVTFPVQNRSDYNSDCSISRYSCLAGLNIESNSIGHATECSQETNDTDFETTGVKGHERAPRPPNSQQAGLIHLGKESMWTDESDHITTVYGYVNAIKRVLASATLQRKNSCRSCKQAGECFDSNIITRESGVNSRDSVNEIGAMEVQTFASQMMTDRPATTLKDLFDDESKCDSVSSSQTTDSKTMTKSHCSLDFSSMEEDEGGSSSSHDEFLVRHFKYKSGQRTSMTPVAAAADNKANCPEDFPQKKCACYDGHFPSFSDNNLMHSEGKAQRSVPESELRSCDQQQVCREITRMHPLQLRSQRALFLDAAVSGDSPTAFDPPIVEPQTTGTSLTLWEKTEVFCASALLGLGFYGLGLEHDFFYGLTL